MSVPFILSFLGGVPGGGELLFVFAVLLLLFGAKKLPGIARTLGKTLEQFRRAVHDVTDEIMKNDEPSPPRPLDVPEETTESGDSNDAGSA